MIRDVDTESSDAVPATLNSGETFTWSTDHSVTRGGWQICFSEVRTPEALQCGSTVRGSTRGLASRIGHSSGEATFIFRAGADPVTFDLCQSEYDSYIRILDDSGSEVAANDDHNGLCSNPQHRYASHLRVSLQEGRLYTVVVEGFRGNEDFMNWASLATQLIPLLVGKRYQGLLWAATMYEAIDQGMPPTNLLLRKPNTLLTRVKAHMTRSFVCTREQGRLDLMMTMAVDVPQATAMRLTSLSARR